MFHGYSRQLPAIAMLLSLFVCSSARADVLVSNLMLSTFGDSSDSGVSWNYHDDPFFPYFLQVNGIAANVPEPVAGVVMALCAGLAFSGAHRRRRQTPINN